MDETAQMLRLRNDKDELGDVDGSFPVFLTRWAASWTWPDFAILCLVAHCSGVTLNYTLDNDLYRVLSLESRDDVESVTQCHTIL